jgi:exoribonuclease-2
MTPPIEGKLVRGEKGLDVGDRLRVRLAHVDIERGFIDFERAAGPIRESGDASWAPL